MKTKVLDVYFDNYTNEEAKSKLMSFLKEDKNHILITPNPEIVMTARNDLDFRKIVNEAELVIPDGIGIVIASKFNKIKLKERVAGYDLMQSLFKEIKNTDYTVYFLGGKPEVALKAKKEMEKLHKGIKIVGVNDGYFNNDEEKEIVSEIRNLRPDILLIGLGCPRQEKFAYKYKDELHVKISCCIGGSLDGMAGEVKRAPAFFQKIGMEWFYRLIKQPSRIKRMYKLPVFLLLVIKEKIMKPRDGE